MSISWFCHSCLKDIDGEVPMNSNCDSCLMANKNEPALVNGNLAGESPCETN